MNDAKSTAAHALMNLRGRAGLTQKELADSAGVTERTISSFENGDVWPRASTLSKLENALGLEGGYFQQLKGSAVYPAYEAPTTSSGIERTTEIMSSQKLGAEAIPDLDLIDELKTRLLSADRDRNWLMQQVQTSGRRVEELEDELAQLRAQLAEKE